MVFRVTSIGMNQVGKIKQIAEFLKFIFFNARRVYINIKVTRFHTLNQLCLLRALFPQRKLVSLRKAMGDIYSYKAIF